MKKILLLNLLIISFSTNAGMFIEPYGTWESSALTLENKIGTDTAEWLITGTTVGGRMGLNLSGLLLGIGAEYGKRKAEVVSNSVPGLQDITGSIVNYSLIVGYHEARSPVRIFASAIASKFKDDDAGYLTGVGWGAGVALGVHPVINIIIDYRKILFAELEDVPIVNRPTIEGFGFGISMPLFM